MLDDAEKMRIYWACRRGMRELDLLLIPFFENQYAHLSVAEQETFVNLLTKNDPELYAWLMGNANPESEPLQQLILKIKQNFNANDANK